MERIVGCVTTLYPNATQLDNRGYTGGYLCIGYGGKIMKVTAIGTPSLEKWQGWFENSQNKVRALMSHPGSISSYGLRNPAQRIYGGGLSVAIPDLTLAFSGLSEQLDEAMCAVALALVTRNFDDAKWSEVARISGNLYMRVFGKLSHLP